MSKDHISGIKCRICDGVVRRPTPDLFRHYELGKHDNSEDCMLQLAEKVKDLEGRVKYLERDIQLLDCPRNYDG